MPPRGRDRFRVVCLCVVRVRFVFTWLFCAHIHCIVYEYSMDYGYTVPASSVHCCACGFEQLKVFVFAFADRASPVPVFVFAFADRASPVPVPRPPVPRDDRTHAHRRHSESDLQASIPSLTVPVLRSVRTAVK